MNCDERGREDIEEINVARQYYAIGNTTAVLSLY